MANTKEIQKRMKSIQDTMKITSAMYMLSLIHIWDVLLAFVMKKKKLFYVKKVYFLLTLFIVNEVHDEIVVNI